MDYKVTMKFSILLLIVFIISSCAVKQETVDIEGKNAEEILNKVKLYNDSVRSIKAFAKVKINTSEDKISYSQVTVAQKPDLLRLEALNPFGKAVGFISSDGENIYIISPSERGTYNSSTEFNLAYVYPGLDIEISAANLVNLVLGRLPNDIYDLDLKPEMSADSGLIKLSFHSNDTDANTHNILWLDSQNYRVERAAFNLQETTRAEINYSYFDGLINGYYFPQTIEFSTKDLSITITYEPDIEINTNIDKSLFKP